MASASKTPNLNLPQWVGTEKPERTDFNTAFDAIDTAVEAVSTSIDTRTSYALIETSRDLSIAGTQTIPLSDGMTPKMIKINSFVHGSVYKICRGKWTNKLALAYFNLSDGTIYGILGRIVQITENLNQDATYAVVTSIGSAGIVLTWTKTGSGGTGTANLFIEVYY